VPDHDASELFEPLENAIKDQLILWDEKLVMPKDK